jgi:hypothetical protein
MNYIPLQIYVYNDGWTTPITNLPCAFTGVQPIIGGSFGGGQIINANLIY